MSNSTVTKTQGIKTKTADVTKDNGIYKLISFEDVREVVKRVLNSDVDSIEYNIKPYSNGKIGFLGSHYCLNVITTRRRKISTLTFFVKTVPYEVPDHTKYVMKKGIFKQEIKFYNTIMPLLSKEYRGEPWAPICYKAKENLMIFEELYSKGYSMRNKLFDKMLASASLSAIARLHAASLLAEARLGTSFDRLYPDVFIERAFARDEMSRAWFEAGVDVAVVVAEHLGHNSKLVRSTCERVYHAVQPSRTKANVISHGDLWANNLMFNDNLPPKCLLVDYQLLRYCPLAHDVAQFLYLCTDRSFRKTWENAMLRHYYETLLTTLETYKMCSIFAQMPLWSEVIEGMEEQRLGAVITAIMYFPTVLMDENLSARVIGDSTFYTEYYFRNRKKFVLTNMRNDPIYARRISEVVTELIELASKLDQLPSPS